MNSSYRPYRRVEAGRPARLALVGILLVVLVVLLSTCKHAPDDAEGDPPVTPTPTQSVRVDPPDGATVTGFRFSHRGMYWGPFYSIRQVEGGFECAVTNGDVYWPAMDGEDFLPWSELSPNGSYGYLDYGGDPLGADSYHSAVLLDDADMAEFTELLAEHGVFGWDGFDEQRTWEEGFQPTDTGDTFDLRILLSDGTHMSAHGVDVTPDDPAGGMNAIMRWFEAHADYSAYYPTELPDAQVLRLTIEFLPVFYRPGTSDFKIELNRGRGQWAVLLRDGKGEFLDEGTDLSDYATVDDADTLPFDRFMNLLAAYDVASWNNTTYDEGKNTEQWTVHVAFDNGQYVEIRTDRHPEWYEAFRADVVREIIAYYDEVRGQA